MALSTGSKDPIADIVREFHGVLNQLSSQECFRELTSGLGEVVRLREQASTLEEQLHAQEFGHKQDITNLEANHDFAMQKFLETHRAMFAKMSGKIGTLETEIKEQKGQLQSERDAYREKADYAQKLEATIDDLTEQLKAKEKTLIRLEKEKNEALNEAKQAAANVNLKNKGLERARDDLSQLRESNDALSKEKTSITKKWQSVYRELEKVKSYASEIHREEPKSEVFERLASSFRDVVVSCFRRGPFGKYSSGKFSAYVQIMSLIMQNPRPWKKYLESVKLPNELSIPASNTPAAKSVRAVMALAFLADQLSSRLFQPCYHVGAQSLRPALTDEAETNPEKELLCRAMLLSLATPEQAEHGSDIVAQIIKDATSLAGILMPPPKAHEFGEMLRPIIEEAFKVWIMMQRCKTKVEADMSLEDMQFSKIIDGLNGLNAGAAIDDGGATWDEAVLVLFPRIYTICKDGWKELFSGVVLRRWQLQPAEEECERMASSNPTSRARRGSVPARAIGRRLSDVHQNGVNDKKPREEAFLELATS